MTDFHILQCKLEPPTLIDKVCGNDYFECDKKLKECAWEPPQSSTSLLSKHVLSLKAVSQHASI